MDNSFLYFVCLLLLKLLLTNLVFSSLLDGAEGHGIWCVSVRRIFLFPSISLERKE